MGRIFAFPRYVQTTICKECGCINEKTINYKPLKDNFDKECKDCGSLFTNVSFREKDKN